jgi:ribonuclease HII
MTGPTRRAARSVTLDPAAPSVRAGPRRGRSLSPTNGARDRHRPAGWYRERVDPDHAEERALRALGHRFVAGIDEVGRGCLAGPVVAAAVILPPDWTPAGLRDSKLLKPEERERLDVEIRAHALAWSLAAVEPALIDRLNILQATLLAAQLAAGRLRIRPDALLFDGSLVLGDLHLPQWVVVDGDRLCASIAAASVVAKVARDRLMVELDADYPGYGLASNKGYAAPDHRAGLAALGLTPIHRRTFASCAEVEQLGLWGGGVGSSTAVDGEGTEANGSDEESTETD